MTRTTIHKRLMLAALEHRVTPATYVVDALTDSGAGSGSAGDLRYCITQANLNSGLDTIDASGLTGTILLNSELPAFIDDTTVFGPGTGQLDIDGNLGVRLFQVSGSGSTKVEFAGLKFTNGGTTGHGGVALVTNAMASFTDCVLNNSFSNQGGLLFGTTSSTINLYRCTLSGSSGTVGGGAVYSTGTLNIHACTLSGNNTGPFGSGGAVMLGGASVANIVNSTISTNSAAIHGGAIRVLSGFNGTLTIKNSTITQNMVLDSSGTGRGLSRAGSGGTINIVSSIVAQNSGGAASTSDVTGSILGAYCLFGTSDAATITGNGNFKGTNMSPVNAKLGPLTNNGGSTLTHLPANDSPVREAGVTPDLLTEDQRGPGYDRTEGYFTDIGAVETQYFAPMASADVPIITEKSAATTFQFQVTYFDKRGSQLIDFSSIGNGDLYVADQKSYLEFPTFISAVPGADAQTIVATYEMPVPVNGAPGWDISDNGDYGVIVLSGEVLDKDMPTPNSVTIVYFAFIQVQIPVVYTVDEVSDVVDMKTGPGELSLREAMTIANTDNQFSKIEFDPTVFNTATTITLSGTELAINEPLALVGPAAALTIDGDAKSRILNTTGAGANASIDISRLTITNGKPAPFGNGGGLYFGDEKVTLEEVTVSNCEAGSRGGGIYVDAAGAVNTITLRDCLVTGNKASNFGGGIHFAYGGELNLIRCTISNNVAASTGGGIDLYALRSVNIVESAITGNQTGDGDALPRGGGLYFRTFVFSPSADVTIANTTISNNVAINATTLGGVGGGISLQNGTPGTFTLLNSTITGNTTGGAGTGTFGGGGGGGIRIVYGYTNFQSSIIAGNTSGDGRDILGMQYSGRGPDTIFGSNNLIGVGDTGVMMLQPGNLTGTKAAPLDAKLGPLADNGGPTKTHALLPGSPAIGAGSNLGGLEFDQRGPGFARSVGQTDIGAFEVQSVAPVPAKVTSVQINDGSAQRSMVTSLTITFDNPPTLPANPADAFELVRQSPAGTVTIDAMVSGNSVTLTFTGGTVDNQSLADGLYALTILASQMPNLDGDGNGTPGDDFELIGNTATNKLFRLFGDADGNGTVNATDFNAFRLAYGTMGMSIFDFDNNGSVTAADFNAFRLRYGVTI